jgi:hypothetical protein
VIATEIVARFTTGATTPAGPVACGECATPVAAGEPCPTCRQLAAPAGPVGVLAVAYTTTAGEERIALVERTPAGGWVPVRNLNADPKAVRMLRRQAAYLVDGARLQPLTRALLGGGE